MTTDKQRFKHMDMAYIHEISDGDNEFITDIIKSYLETTSPNVQQLSVAVQQNNVQDVLFLAHKLKGTFRFIGCNGIGDMLDVLEAQVGKSSVADAMVTMTSIENSCIEVEAELRAVMQELTGQ